MIIKITAFCEIEGHADEVRSLSEILSRELTTMLSSKRPKLNSKVLKEIKETNPKFISMKFISHEQVLERLRTKK